MTPPPAPSAQPDPHGRLAPPDARPAMVELLGVSRYYGRKVAVQDLSLRVVAGEVFAFLGPNGAGKTTTLKVAAGLLRPTQGQVRICGYCMAREGRQARQLLAFVPDQPFLYDKLTGREFIRFVREMYGVPQRLAQDRLDELSRRLEMDGFLDQLAESYSHGMKQKVALAAALIHAPRVLIVDEPLVGLDPRSVRVIKTVFREIAARGGAVFMSTHTLEVAEAVADRLAIINAGRLVACGTLDELRQAAASAGGLEEVFLRLTEQPAGDDSPGRPGRPDDPT